jgi:hypothetical protein
MIENINEILEKYWEGETSVEEEKILKQYFTSETVAEEHQTFAPLFRYFDHQEQITYTLPSVEDIRQKVTEDVPVKTLSPFRKYIYAIAAVFTLAVAALVVWQTTQPKEEMPLYVQEIEDPEEAYRITMQALAMVSGKLNKGTESISIGIDNLNKANIFK